MAVLSGRTLLMEMRGQYKLENGRLKIETPGLLSGTNTMNYKYTFSGEKLQLSDPKEQALAVGRSHAYPLEIISEHPNHRLSSSVSRGSVRPPVASATSCARSKKDGTEPTTRSAPRYNLGN